MLSDNDLFANAAGAADALRRAYDYDVLSKLRTMYNDIDNLDQGRT